VRILFVVHGFPPDAQGGAELHTASLASSLAESGHDVFVFAAGRRGNPGEVWDDSYERVDVRRIGVSVAADFAMKLEDGWVRTEFERFVDEVRPDVVHVQHLLYLSLDLVETAAQRAPVTAVTLHDFWFQCPRIHLTEERHPLRGPAWGLACARHHEIRSLRRHVRRARLARRQLAAADVVIAPSRFVYERFRRFGVPARKLVVVPHATDAWSSAAPGLAPPIDFGFVGSIAPAKGVHVLCEAFARVPDGSRLKIFGRSDDPAYMDALASSFGERVRYEGEFDHGRVGEVFDRFDVLVVPSLVQESFSLVTLEGLASRRPVIASHVGGIPELIEHGKNGLLVTPGDVDSLAGAMTRLQDVDAVRRLQTAARPPLSPEAHARRMEGLYAAAAAGR
jgi:glycosyltransferase involved in cell wall biosynthesis